MASRSDRRATLSLQTWSHVGGGAGALPLQPAAATPVEAAKTTYVSVRVNRTLFITSFISKASLHADAGDRDRTYRLRLTATVQSTIRSDRLFAERRFHPFGHHRDPRLL